MLCTSLFYLCNIFCHHPTLLDCECGFCFLSWERLGEGTFPLQTNLEKGWVWPRRWGWKSEVTIAGPLLQSLPTRWQLWPQQREVSAGVPEEDGEQLPWEPSLYLMPSHTDNFHKVSLLNLMAGPLNVHLKLWLFTFSLVYLLGFGTGGSGWLLWRAYHWQGWWPWKWCLRVMAAQGLPLWP